MEPLYDPRLASSTLKSSRRGRSASFSALSSSSANSPPLQGRTSSTLTRRPSFSFLPTAYGNAGNLSDDEQRQEAPLVDLGGGGRASMDLPPSSGRGKRSLSGPFRQDAKNEAADKALQREGRQSKAALEEKPALKTSADMEGPARPC